MGLSNKQGILSKRLLNLTLQQLRFRLRFRLDAEGMELSLVNQRQRDRVLREIDFQLVAEPGIDPHSATVNHEDDALRLVIATCHSPLNLTQTPRFGGFPRRDCPTTSSRR